jgi:hypothetical protein
LKVAEALAAGGDRHRVALYHSKHGYARQGTRFGPEACDAVWNEAVDLFERVVLNPRRSPFPRRRTLARAGNRSGEPVRQAAAAAGLGAAPAVAGVRGCDGGRPTRWAAPGPAT